MAAGAAYGAPAGDPAVGSWTDPVHVLFIVDELIEMGGAERALMRIIQLLPRDRFRPTAITFRADLDQPLVAGFPCPLTVVPLGRTVGWNALRAARRIRRYIREQDVRIVNTFFETSDLWGGLVVKSTGRVVLISSRRDMGILRNAKHRHAYRLLRGIFDRIITVSEGVRQYCLEVDRLAPERVVTVYNGIEDRLPEKTDRSAVRASLGLRDSDLVITTVGHVRKVKGVDIFARTALHLERRFPDARFVVVGDVHEPGHMAELHGMIARGEAGAQMRFVGPREDIPSILAASDVFVLPSRSEGFSNALIEAMLCGLPCVATDVGGNAEALQDGESGLVVPSESVECMSEALARLLQDAELRRRMGQAGRRRALQAFSLEGMMNGLMNVYDAALRGRKEYGS